MAKKSKPTVQETVAEKAPAKETVAEKATAKEAVTEVAAVAPKKSNLNKPNYLSGKLPQTCEIKPDQVNPSEILSKSNDGLTVVTIYGHKWNLTD